jgi:hypothetical protein
MQATRALLFGAIPEAYLSEYEIAADLAAIEAKLGVRIDVVPHAALMARYETQGPAEREQAAALAKDLVAGAQSRLRLRTSRTRCASTWRCGSTSMSATQAR